MRTAHHDAAYGLRPLPAVVAAFRVRCDARPNIHLCPSRGESLAVPMYLFCAAVCKCTHVRNIRNLHEYHHDCFIAMRRARGTSHRANMLYKIVYAQPCRCPAASVIRYVTRLVRQGRVRGADFGNGPTRSTQAAQAYTTKVAPFTHSPCPASSPLIPLPMCCYVNPCWRPLNAPMSPLAAATLADIAVHSIWQ